LGDCWRNWPSVASRSGLPFQLLSNKFPFARKRADQFLRIAHEALNNVVKHARPDGYSELERQTAACGFNRRSEERIKLEVQDDGVGFSSAKRRATTGDCIMYERAAAIQATYLWQATGLWYAIGINLAR